MFKFMCYIIPVRVMFLGTTKAANQESPIVWRESGIQATMLRFDLDMIL